MSVEEPTASETSESSTDGDRLQQDIFANFLREQHIIEERRGDVGDETSSSDDIPISSLPPTGRPHDRWTHDDFDQVARALRQFGDQSAVDREHMLRLPGIEQSFLSYRNYMDPRYKIWSSIYGDRISGISDLIFCLASNETSTEKLLLLLLLRVLYDLPVKRIARYLHDLWNRLWIRNDEQNGQGTLQETDPAPLVDSSTVHWDFMSDTPSDLPIREDEAIISCGIRFSPSGAKLSTPVKVTLDHNAHFTNPRRAQIAFYTRGSDEESFIRIPASTVGFPCCDVRAKDLDVYVDHFSDWWIVALITRYFVGKRVNCTPYVLPPVNKVVTNLILLCIHDDLSEVIKKVKEEMANYRKLYPPQPMFVEWKSGDIEIKFFEGPRGKEEKIDETRIDERDISLLDRRQVSFDVESPDSGASQKLLKFNLQQGKSQCDPTLIRFILSYDDVTAPVVASSSGVPLTIHGHPETLGRPQRLRDDLESDRILDKLAKHIPAGTYTTLCPHLGLGYNEADGILARFLNDYQKATRHCLAQWKTRTGGDLTRLKTILQDAEVGDLARYIE